MVLSKIYVLQSRADVVKMQILIQESKAGTKASVVLPGYQTRLRDHIILNSKDIKERAAQCEKRRQEDSSRQLSIN